MSRVLEELSVDECLALLADAPMGRVVFTDRALPAIRPVNHILDAGAVIIRTRLGGSVASTVGSARGVVVAYQADKIDPDEHTGWSVVATGVARLVTDPGDRDRYERLLRPWVSMEADCVIRIEPQLITGYRMLDPAAAVR
jgi:nitroimidazol reductase NimA-like FMN-containing flavoprotein (pyridoxamine 5'-phosphate oxidase superfamily)